MDFANTAILLLKKLSICSDMAKLDEDLGAMMQPDERVRVLSFVNAHAVIRSQSDTGFRNALLASDVLYRDGSGMEMLLRQVSRNPGLNLNGTDLIPKLIACSHRSTKVALLGTKDPRIELAKKYIYDQGFSDVIAMDGFKESHEYIELLRKHQPKLVILGMGMPKQERLSIDIVQDSVLRDKDIVVVNGGAILDFLSGDIPRAPKLMQDLGIEWLYRLIREPVRMFPRFINSIAFALNVKLYRSSFTKILKSSDTSIE